MDGLYGSVYPEVVCHQDGPIIVRWLARIEQRQYGSSSHLATLYCDSREQAFQRGAAYLRALQAIPDPERIDLDQFPSPTVDGEPTTEAEERWWERFAVTDSVADGHEEGRAG